MDEKKVQDAATKSKSQLPQAFQKETVQAEFDDANLTLQRNAPVMIQNGKVSATRN